MRISDIPDAEELKTIARARGREARSKVGKAGNKLAFRRKLESATIKAATEALVQRLGKPSKEIGDLADWHLFYREMLGTMIDVGKLKQALAQLQKSAKIITRIKMQGMKRVFSASSEEEAKKATREYWGRVFSVVDRAAKSIAIIRRTSKELRKMPQIKTEFPTAIIAGMPNVGKTTLLSRLTKSKPKVAGYPFTTQGLMIGHMEHKYHTLQLVDTPGLLDRDITLRNPIERQAIAALGHLGKLIVFVVDPTEQCGYSIQQQHALYEQVREMFPLPILKVFNKSDRVSPEQKESVQALFSPPWIWEGEGIASGLKAEIGEKLGKGAA